MDLHHHPLLPSLVEELHAHRVNTNLFFQKFSALDLNDVQLKVFVSQYHYFCRHFVKLLEGLLYRTPIGQLDMRIELTKTLYSELGSGNPEAAHISLLNSFARTLGLDEATLNRTVPIPSVQSYLTTLHSLFIDSDYLTALGAEMAVELTAASEFHYLYAGLTRTGRFSERDLVFFRLHMEEEVCHGSWLVDAVARTATSAADYAHVVRGARHTADAWHEFWLGLDQHVFRDLDIEDLSSLTPMLPGSGTPTTAGRP